MSEATAVPARMTKVTLYGLFQNVRALGRALRVVVHDGIFHADDVGSLGMLMYLAEKAGTQIDLCRTRNQDNINKADIVIDVGGTYNLNAFRFDHHGKGGAGRRPGKKVADATENHENEIPELGTPYSGIGLLWKDFGEEFIEAVVDCECEKWAQSLFRMGRNRIISKVHREIDQKLIEGICAHDAGMITSVDGSNVNVISYPTSISRRNPTGVTKGFGPKLQKEAMIEAAKDFKVTLLSSVLQSLDMQLGVSSTQEAIKKTLAEGSGILELDFTSQAWRMLVPKVPEILLVIQPQVGERTVHGIIAVPTGKKQCRILFPEEWAGHGEEALTGITGIRGALFCHEARFYASATTAVAARMLAEETVVKARDAN